VQSHGEDYQRQYGRASYTENKVILDSHQSFARGRSCLKHLLEFQEEVNDKLDKGKAVDAIYLDLTKAFDKVSHIRIVKNIGSKWY
jgi:hypothetical protein